MASHVEEKVGINGGQLRIRLEGREDAPAVVFAHSLGTNLRLWDLQVPALASGYRVLRYDARGHGHSDPPAGGLTIDLLADDLLDLIDYCDIKRAYIVGVSLGALTALEAALRGNSAVKGIVAANTRVEITPEFAAGIDQRNAQVRSEGLGSLADSQPMKWISPASAQEHPELLEKLRTMFLATSPEGFMAGAEAVKFNDLSSSLGDIKIPTLFIGTDQDEGLPIEAMRAMQAQVPGAELVEIAGAGHLPNLEQPDAFNAALLQFLYRT